MHDRIVHYHLHWKGCYLLRAGVKPYSLYAPAHAYTSSMLLVHFHSMSWSFIAAPSPFQWCCCTISIVLLLFNHERLKGCHHERLKGCQLVGSSSQPFPLQPSFANAKRSSLRLPLSFATVLVFAAICCQPKGAAANHRPSPLATSFAKASPGHHSRTA